MIVHRSRHNEVVERLGAAFSSLRIGSPLEVDTLVGPLINVAAYERMRLAMENAQADGGQLVVGGERLLAHEAAAAAYTRPAIITMPEQTSIVATETFAPLLYVMQYDDFDEAVAMQNGVPQGLASSVFTNDVREAERFCAANGSDCGHRQRQHRPERCGDRWCVRWREVHGRRPARAGSDAWKAYMRRATNTVNYSTDLPLAQGVRFG